MNRTSKFMPDGKTTCGRGLIRQVIIITVICLAIATGVGPVTATTLFPDFHHFYINVANDAGVKWDLDSVYYGGPGAVANNTYYLKADGSGLNELHITNANDEANARGQVTVNSAQSGVFYISNTGGRGFDNDIILLVSVKGPIPDDFSVHIKTSGYNWTPATPGAYTPTVPTDYYYVPNAMDETFTKADFIYGPHIMKPGPGGWLPLYVGQDTANTSTEEYLMFVDCYAGNMYPSKVGATLVDNGNVKVEYSFTDLNTRAEFNGYGWTTASNQNEGINWGNPTLTGNPVCGYSVLGVPSTPAPITIVGQPGVPTDPDGDGKYEDMNGNGRKDFNDVFIFFKQMAWISANEPVSLFDFNNNSRIDFNDIFILFKDV
jgi:hypothetical protein